MKFFADTSGWMTLFQTTNPRHQAVKAWLQTLVGQGHRIVTTDYVVDETLTGLLTRVNHRTALAFVDWLQKQRHVEVIRITPEQWESALQMFRRYDDKGFSFTDCTSFIIMQQHKLFDALALDQHFAQMGFHLWPKA